MFEFIFHGTGTSSSLPNVSCLTDPNTTCTTCPATMTPEGWKNRRRNTGAILRKWVKGHPNPDGTTVEDREMVVVIDVGKTFLNAAHDLFPKHGLRRIDAVLLTHAHADAINGLDDLRAWTLGSVIQPHIDIYLSVATFTAVKKTFPYLVEKEFATGGGDVPEFKWHFIKENVEFELECGGFRITPVAVDHGRMFPSAPIPQPFTPDVAAPSPSQSASSTPLLQSLKHLAVNPTASVPQSTIPYKCMGFIINSTLLYMADVSNIPEEEWKIILHPTTETAKETGAAANGSVRENQFSMLVLDVLKPQEHTSHFGIKKAVDAARKINATRTYMLGFTHDLNHEEWVAVGKGIESLNIGSKALADGSLAQNVQTTLGLVEEGASVWMRPAYDGLKIMVPEMGEDYNEVPME